MRTGQRQTSESYQDGGDLYRPQPDNTRMSVVERPVVATDLRHGGEWNNHLYKETLGRDRAYYQLRGNSNAYKDSDAIYNRIYGRNPTLRDRVVATRAPRTPIRPPLTDDQIIPGWEYREPVAVDPWTSQPMWGSPDTFVTSKNRPVAHKEGGGTIHRPTVYTRNYNGPGGFRPPTSNYANPSEFPKAPAQTINQSRQTGGRNMLMRAGKCGGVMYGCGGRV